MQPALMQPLTMGAAWLEIGAQVCASRNCWVCAMALGVGPRELSWAELALGLEAVVGTLLATPHHQLSGMRLPVGERAQVQCLLHYRWSLLPLGAAAVRGAVSAAGSPQDSTAIAAAPPPPPPPAPPPPTPPCTPFRGPKF